MIFVGDITSSIRGYSPNEGPAYHRVSSLVKKVGGGHGGRGGYGTSDLGTSYAYGSTLFPKTWGSGGKGNGGRGGGFLQFDVYNKFRIEGTVSSNGESLETGGAGGSILINAFHFDGDGAIEVIGGSGSSGGGGGGGRIAAYYTNQSTYIGAIQAYGGKGFSDTGGAGTIYIQNSSLPASPHRTLKVMNRLPERKLHPQEPKVFGMSGDIGACESTTLNYANGIQVTTSAEPYCPYKTDSRGKRHYIQYHKLSHMFSKGSYYLSSSSVATINISFPFALYLHSIKVYPISSQAYETSFKVATYKTSIKLSDTDTWVSTFGVYNGLGSEIQVAEYVDKVNIFCNLCSPSMMN